MSCTACVRIVYASTSVPLGRDTSVAFSPIGVTIQCVMLGLGKPPVLMDVRSSMPRPPWIATMTSQLRKGWKSLPGSAETSSSASCQLPHRVPMPSMPLGPA